MYINILLDTVRATDVNKYSLVTTIQYVTNVSGHSRLKRAPIVWKCKQIINVLLTYTYLGLHSR